MNKGNDLVSLVVPVYNVKDYVIECIDSIINQTYRNIEIILVDDGSTDGCSEICDVYAKEDARITVIHQKNQGLSEARNVGLRMSKGKYIAFIDSDDYISSQYVEILYSTVVNKKCDIACCQLYRFYNNHNTVKQAELYEIIECSNVEALANIYENKLPNIEFTVCNKLYTRDIFIKNELEFPKGKFHEDAFITYKLLYYASSVAMIDANLYFYRVRPNSIMTATVTEKRLDALYAHQEALEFYKNNNEVHLLNLEFNAFCNLCVYIYSLTFDMNDSVLKKRMREKINVIFDIQWDELKNVCNLGILKKLFYGLFHFNPVVSSRIRMNLRKK